MIATMLAMVATGTSVRRFAVITTMFAMGGLAMIATMLAMVATGTSVRRFTVVAAVLAMGRLSVVAARFAMRRTAGFTAVTTTAIPLPGFTHAFKTLTHLFAFLLAHVAPSLPHGGTP